MLNRSAKKKSWLLLYVALILASPTRANGHTVVEYISTPVTPPLGFLWVPVAFVLSIVVLDWLMLRKSVSMDFLVGIEAFSIGIFLIIVFGLSLAFIFLTGQLFPSPGPPGMPFYGYSLWSSGLSLAVNALVLLLFIEVRRRVFGAFRNFPPDRHKNLIVNCTVVYLLMLVPFIATNALMHGFTSTYILKNCNRRLDVLGKGLIQYAKAHKNTLPQADSAVDLFAVLKPYLKNDEMFQYYEAEGEDIMICPSETVYRKEPRTYVWNPGFSGTSLASEASNPDSDPILQCPSIHGSKQYPYPSPAIFSADLIDLQSKTDGKSNSGQ